MTRFLKPAFQSVLSLFLLFTLFVPAARAADDFLDPEQAFRLTVKALDEKTLEASFEIAPGYYMYRERFKADAQGATLAEPVIPAGHTKFDETFQKTVEIYREHLTVRLPVTQADGQFKLTVEGQGCADKGLCYPPMATSYNVKLAGFGGATSIAKIDAVDTSATAAPAAVAPAPIAAPATTRSDNASESNRLHAALQSGHFWTILGVFFVAGLLLSLTPCVLPMLPILSSIIVGSTGKATRSRGLLLAVSYSLGMALVYTALGVAAGLAGEGLAAALQKPWVLSVFALALVVFSLSMFGAYELQLPSGMTGGLSSASQRIPAGKVTGVFVMGGVSALIVSPCVAAPLAGALVYLSQTRDVLLGGSALFALASGMSVPLLLLGASAGALLPRAGAWMDGVKHFFGILLLGVALWTINPILPAAVAQALWGALLIGMAGMLGLFKPGNVTQGPLTWLGKTIALVAVVFGLLQLVGAAAGGTDPLKPIAGLSRGAGGNAAAPSAEVHFETIGSVSELDAAVSRAGKPVMLDFYADWCVSCKEMDRDTFTDAAVRERLSHALLLRADVTANSPADRELLKRFKLFGPPGTIFFDAKGQEQKDRVIGFQNVETFLSSLNVAGL